MINTQPEIFSRDFYIALKQTWLTYIKQEIQVKPEYFLFYTMVKGKSPFRVFSPIVKEPTPEYPWCSLDEALAYVNNELGFAAKSGKYRLRGSRAEYDKTNYKWTYLPDHEIALSPEQIAYLIKQINLTKLKTKDKDLYATFQEKAAKAKEIARAKRLANPYRKSGE